VVGEEEEGKGAILKEWVVVQKGKSEKGDKKCGVGRMIEESTDVRRKRRS